MKPTAERLLLGPEGSDRWRPWIVTLHLHLDISGLIEKIKIIMILTIIVHVYII